MEHVADHSLFLHSVQITLAEWEALTAAIENGMGGLFVDEKLAWFSDVIVAYYKDTTKTRRADKKADLTKFDRKDAQEYIEEIMNREFDTLLEDDSTIQIVNKIFDYFVLSETEKFDELRNKLSDKFAVLARQHNRVENAINHRKQAHELDDVDMEDDSDEDYSEGDENGQEMEDGENLGKASTSSRRPKPSKSAEEELEEADGWSKVGKRR